MGKDRRRSKRIPLTLSIAKPIKLEINSDQYENTIPGILVNLSADGMALIAFHKLPEESLIDFSLSFLGIEEQLEGKVVREEKRYENTYLVGIEFERSVKKLKELVAGMAEDFDICELRYLMNMEDACFPDCSFRELCAKRIKKDF